MSIAITKKRLAQDFITRNSSLAPQINAILDEISKDPFVDAKTKFYWPIPPIMVTLCVKDSLWVLYHVNTKCTQIDVWNIGKKGDKPTVR